MTLEEYARKLLNKRYGGLGAFDLVEALHEDGYRVVKLAEDGESSEVANAFGGYELTFRITEELT